MLLLKLNWPVGSFHVPTKLWSLWRGDVAADSRSKSTAESFIIDTWLVSCAASGSRFACASPGSVAAYHGALSRLRLGSNPDSGAPFLPVIDERSFSALGKKCKLECKLFPQPNHSGLSDLVLQFRHEDLSGYLTLRAAGLTSKTVTWLKKSAELLWDSTRGMVSVTTTQHLRDSVLAKYRDPDAKRKVLAFARGFLRYMTKTHFDERYAAFDLFLEFPRSVKERKLVTSRIVTKDDVENVLRAVEQAHNNGQLDYPHYLNYKALVLFGAFHRTTAAINDSAAHSGAV